MAYHLPRSPIFPIPRHWDENFNIRTDVLVWSILVSSFCWNLAANDWKTRFTGDLTQSNLSAPVHILKARSIEIILFHTQGKLLIIFYWKHESIKWLIFHCFFYVWRLRNSLHFPKLKVSWHLNMEHLLNIYLREIHGNRKYSSTFMTFKRRHTCELHVNPMFRSEI